MTQYLLSVSHVDDGPSPYANQEAMQAAFDAVDAFNTELQEAGAWVFAGGLQPPATATTVDATDGEVIMTDGPWGESKEHIGGFWVIEAPDLDEALRWAEKGSRACANPVEVRPFQDEGDS